MNIKTYNQQKQIKKYKKIELIFFQKMNQLLYQNRKFEFQGRNKQSTFNSKNILLKDPIKLKMENVIQKLF